MKFGDNKNQSDKVLSMWTYTAFWLVIVSSSYIWSTATEQGYFSELIRQRAEMIYEVVMVTRRWNASHGGVYVPITETSPPSPYLKVKQKNIETLSGKKLTLINPAYMTRQLSEIMAEDQHSLNIKLTSLDPLNPNNEPDEWERAALQSFEKGETNKIEVIEENGVEKLSYMAALKVDASCLSCHESQVGDVRGGLRVTFSSDEIYSERRLYKRKIILFHVIGFLFANLFTYISLHKTRTLIERLKQERLSRDQIINEKTKELEKLAGTDTLTGAHNRRALDLYLDKKIQRAKKIPELFSYVLIDLDYFKKVNDTYGHETGDLVLQGIVDRLEKQIRQIDFLARYGGEEFVLIMSNTEKNAAYIAVERIRKAIENDCIEVEGHQIKMTISFGIADSTAGKDMFQAADRALYAAKAKGRNCGMIDTGKESGV